MYMYTYTYICINTYISVCAHARACVDTHTLT